ncbi:hypothetical protein [Pararobbsia alpina]|uniref:hypothetical protein n=1 Tax=Pararobbsia alpina TaxID=621374 RepID=UPI001FEA5F9B|nr:hypothetical protein [Pararobbsia alpina]
MTGAVRRSLTIGLLGLLLAGASCARAQAESDGRLGHRKMRRLPRIVIPPPMPMMQDPVPPEISERRHDGHMNSEERRLLRQHIEDAVRELYKR